MTDGTYKASVFCKNCDFRGEVDIPKGQMIEDTPCPSCENMTIEKDRNVGLGGGGMGRSNFR